MLAFLLVLTIVFYIAQIIFLFNVAEATINFIGGGEGWFVPGNPFAWIVVIIVGLILMRIIRFIFRVINAFAGALLANLITFSSGKNTFYSRARHAIAASITVRVTWIIITIPLTIEAMNYIANNPHLNGWLAEGGWVACTLTYLTILSLVSPIVKDKNDD